MTNHEAVLEALRGVMDPELGLNVVELGMIPEVTIEGSHAIIGLALTIAACPMRTQIEGDVRRRTLSLPGIDTIEIRTSVMGRDQRAQLMQRARKNARDRAQETKVAPTTRVIAIASGKGGVGKSTLTANLAVAMTALGFSVGVLDADIWGFSIPRALGATGRIQASEDKLLIPISAHGVQVISTGLITESEETALMWRGLMLSKALEQFLTQVDWGELDYLLIDMPPGTGDVQMALSRLLPQAEMLVVTTPQVAAQKVAIRVADMARRSFMPILGAVENMSDFICDHGETYAVFGSGGGDQLAADLDIPLLGRVPLDPAVVEGQDNGRPVVAYHPKNPASIAITALSGEIVRVLPPADAESCVGRLAQIFDELSEVTNP
jgi:ATP-binding protein involved in chromosome partitioning